MSDLYKIFDKLIEMQVMFCFQSQKSKYYTLMVHDVHGKEQYLSGYTVDEIERGLKVIWGHLLITLPKIPLPPMPRMMK